MSGWDEGGVFQAPSNVGAGEVGNAPQPSRAARLEAFKRFLKEFRDQERYIYRDALKNNVMAGTPFVQVDVQHLNAWDDTMKEVFTREGRKYENSLCDAIEGEPSEYLPLFEVAAREMLLETRDLPGQTTNVPQIQVVLSNKNEATPMRELKADQVSKLVTIPGIVIGASRTRAKATHITIRCRHCNNTKELPCRPGYGSARLPRVCDKTRTSEVETPCPVDPFFIVGEKSVYVDQQSLKIQERPESVPTGEMPRSILCSVDRTLVNKAKPGMRVKIVGIYSIFQSDLGRKVGPAAVATRSSYIRGVGLEEEAQGAGRADFKFTEEQQEQLRAFSRDPNVIDRIARNIAPNIKGHPHIKKAIACLLFGGSRKRLPDGMRLRGDINVLLLGDPSTAKSQLLKFVEKVSPIGVYTSGKGSSAAGLTASVIRDPSSGEFFLEGGAMVLADNGVVCIDEFDKMRAQDRVAIHEAMEQQTISIAKAGITTILNSRSAVLAAANPKFGSFNDSKETEEQLDFEQTILSRFDLIFFVRDIRDAERDKEIAGHVLKVHMGAADPGRGAEEVDGDMDAHDLKRYIAFCRQACAPTLSEEAADRLRGVYVELRKAWGEKASPIPVTVRQLESLVRVAESLAKMELAHEVTAQHAEQAIELFNQSTKDAVNSGVDLEKNLSSTDAAEAAEIERQIKRRISPQQSMPSAALRKMFSQQRFAEGTVVRVMTVLVQRAEFEYRRGRKQFFRLA